MNNILTSKKWSSLFFKVCIIRNSTINKSPEFFLYYVHCSDRNLTGNFNEMMAEITLLLHPFAEYFL